ncbi:hypothetical protein E4P41_10185 [Geodermatophilus sp. DF01-2]|uniref:DUF6282 family protein n=1 Tax=Geodermatophilus sp. DF01-2 TaxID=2559610 RepID=UPI00107307BA|nr:DUF6282 family protein [Geodermatophilus sp. DF01_2]TFV60875.1 hypothetical protein E4P41_10185 [Geodermatophilus sp. DF01_2]
MFDSHVHAGPDVVDRIGEDEDILQSYVAAGFDGFVLKGHYESTVGRAAALARRSGLAVVGGVALNQTAGGVNPAAAAAALAAGGRVVWMPSADAHTQERAGLPRLCDRDTRLSREVYAVPPVEPHAERVTELVLQLVADHDAVLATGHLSGPECAWLLQRARHFGIRRVLLTHPSYTVPGLTPGEVAELADLGGHVEITAYQLFHQPGCSPQMLAEVARAAGDRLVLASDAGQPDSPPPPEALQQLIAVLAAHGVPRSRLDAAASAVPAELFLR